MVPLLWKNHSPVFSLFRNALGLASTALFLACASWAQAPSVNGQTATPTAGTGHNYIHMLNETVNPANGAVSLRIQVPMPKGRGLALPFSFAYNSGGVWAPASGVPQTSPSFGSNINDANPTFYAENGWSYSLPLVSMLGLGVPDAAGNNCPVETNFVFGDTSGGSYPLSMTSEDRGLEVRGPDFPCGRSGNGSTSGGTDFYSAYVDAFQGNIFVADADGTTYKFASSEYKLGGTIDCFTSGDSLAVSTQIPPASVEDRNGNLINFSTPHSCTGSFTETDTAGRTVLSSSGFGTTGNTVAVAGLGSYTITWGTTASSTALGSTLKIGSTLVCSPTIANNHQPPLAVITAITLPNGQQYKFSYDSTTGLLSKITYPTGGFVSYTWMRNLNAEYAVLADDTNGDPQACTYNYDEYVVQQRTVSYDGSTTALQQTFSYTTTPNANNNGWTQKSTTVTTHDLIQGITYNTQYTYTPMFQPSFFDENLFDSVAPQIPAEQTIVYNDQNGHTLKTANKTWKDLYELANEKLTLDNGQTSEVAYTYSAGGQVTEKDDYDYGLTLKRKTLTTYQSFGTTPIFPEPSVSPLFDRPCKVLVEDGNSNIVAETDSVYDGGSAVCGTAGTAATALATTPTGTHDETNYGSGSSTPRGNATKVTRKCLAGCTTDASTTYSYDEAGQVLSMTDPCGNSTCSDMSGTSHTTTYSYEDNFGSCSGAAPPSGNTDAYLTKVTNPFGFTENFCYGYDDGQLRGTTDENNQTTIYKYADSLRRLTETDLPDGGETLLSYNDTPPTPSVTTNKKLNSSGQFVTSVTIMDGMGLPTETELTSDPAGTDFTVTTYNGVGQIHTVTNPYRSTSDPTYGLTTYTYDVLGRTTQVTHPDSSKIVTSYTGRATEVSDEGNGTKSVQRISQMDGLGRMVSVCEATSATQMGNGGTPGACGQDIAATGFLTSYSYDTLGNVLQVSQGSLTARTFTYDSLAQMTTATNPESGLTTYTYDANGNVASRTQPEENQTSPSETVTTSYVYDTLNRMTAKHYSDDTMDIDYNYDETSPWGFALTNQIGRLTTAYDGNTGNVFSYDAMGRVVQNHQCTPQNCGTGDFPIAYTYDLLGDAHTSTDGEGNTYTRVYNNAAELTSMTSSYVDSNHPANLLSEAGYDAPGQVTIDLLGNGVTETRAYNSRLRMTSLTAGSVYTLSMSSYAPNGNVLGVNDSANGTWTYAYDDFNRLKSSSCSAHCPDGGSTQAFTYGYDRYANRWTQTVTAGSGGNSSLTFTGNNNHIDGDAYDAAGNLMSDGSHVYFYDAEHHLIQVDGSEGWCQSGTGTEATSCYTYDAEGRRVRRTVPGSGITDDYLYDLDGRYITQVSGGGFWIRGEIYAGGRHLATYENDLGTPTTFFEHTDWLGTERVETAVNGTACETIQSVAFGDGLNTAGSCDPSAKYFTGKERDWESNLDNFGARYYSSQIGRFMSADWSAIPAPVPYANFSNPQTLNLYAIVSDNPETFADLDGHEAAITAPTAGGGMDLTGVGSEVSGDLAGFDDNMGAPQYSATPSEQQAPQLSKKSEDAILNSNLTGPQAIAFEDAVLAAGKVDGIDPNILVGIAMKESTLTPTATSSDPRSTASGLFGLTNGVKKAEGLSMADATGSTPSAITNQVNAAAGYLHDLMHGSVPRSHPSEALGIALGYYRGNRHQVNRAIESRGGYGAMLKLSFGGETLGHYIGFVESFQ